MSSRLLALEPYYGGSHRAVLDGLLPRLGWEFELLTLPARKWKWRMRGSAITFAGALRDISRREVSGARPETRPFDLLFASTFVNLAELYGLARGALDGVPSVVYFHENQFVYPNRHTAEWDYQFPLTNITSALAADACVFNTEWTMRTLLDEIPGFIGAFPDHRPAGLPEAIAEKSRVLAPPFDPTPFDELPDRVRGTRARIVWPHRWEHDKNPGEFLDAVARLADEGLEFEVAIAGQVFRETAGEVRDAAAALGDRLVLADEPRSAREYARLLTSCDVAVSTARNEFFGLAMMEACYAGCHPLVPDRLAYPEVYEPEFLYDGPDQLVARLRSLIADRPRVDVARHLAERYTLDALVPRYRALFDEVSDAGRSAR